MESTVHKIWIRNSCKTVDFLKKSDPLLLDVNITLLNFISFQHKRNRDFFKYFKDRPQEISAEYSFEIGLVKDEETNYPDIILS
jgi:hypothetical protein